MELCPGGHLAAVVQKARLSPAQILPLFSQAAAAVNHLHQLSPPLIHRDIKLENYLLARKNVVKLCDFGSVTEKVIDPANIPMQQYTAITEEMVSDGTLF